MIRVLFPSGEAACDEQDGYIWSFPNDLFMEKVLNSTCTPKQVFRYTPNLSYTLAVMAVELGGLEIVEFTPVEFDSTTLY